MDLKIVVKGKSRVARNVPNTSWKALEPYWPPIATAILEVVLNGEFQPRHVTLKKDDGFYAAEPYWERHESDSVNYPLTEAKRFLSMIGKKKSFVRAVKEFNRAKNRDWISEGDQIQFSRFVGTCCQQLEDYIFRYVEESFERTRS